MTFEQEYERQVEKLGKYLGPRRVAHSLSVARTAAELAVRHAPELAAKAWLAGLLHDNAKKMPPEKLIDRARRFEIEVTEYDTQAPYLLHGKVGAALLPARFEINDQEVMEAIADHVTGTPGMSQLSKLLFVADQAEENREFAGVGGLREAALRDLDLAVWLVARTKLTYLLGKGRRIVPSTIDVYNYYRPATIPDPEPAGFNFEMSQGKRKQGGNS